MESNYTRLESTLECENRNIMREKFMKLVGFSAISLLLGGVAWQLARCAKANGARIVQEDKLDMALADSMDCSDATATY